MFSLDHMVLLQFIRIKRIFDQRVLIIDCGCIQVQLKQYIYSPLLGNSNILTLLYKITTTFYTTLVAVKDNVTATDT